MKDKALRLNNGWVDFLIVLLDRPRHGQEARAKSRFLKLLGPRIEEINAEKKRLLEEYGKKDRAGKMIMEEVSVPKKENPKNMEMRAKLDPKAQVEYTEYLKEEFVIDVLPSNRMDIGTIKMMLDADTTELSTLDGVVYDEIMTAFEEALDGKS